MNETKGPIGGRNDRKITLRIKKQKLKKIKQEEKELEIKELEKKVKKQQLLNLIKIIPLALIGNIFNAFKTDENKKAESKNVKRLSTSKQKRELEERNQDIKEIDNNILKTNLEIKSEYKKENENKKYSEEDLDRKISNIKSKRIAAEYENKLKELRRELRNVYFQSNLVAEAKELENEVSEENLEKLNKLIEKVEELKNKIEQENTIEIDNNFISALVEEDLNSLNKNEEVKDLTNSKLFISISNKINRLETEKNKISNKVEETKAFKNIDDESLKEMKEKYEEFNNFNNDLIKFQDEQDRILKDIRSKINTDINKIDNIRIQLNGMHKQSNLLLRNVRRYMRIPGIRSSRKVATITASYLYYFTLMTSNKPMRRRYKKIDSIDYSRQIESNILEIQKVENLLSKTKNQLINIIGNFKSRYYEYASLPEFQKIIKDLEKIKKSLEEKEYELERLKKEQAKNIQKENNKEYIK